MERNNLQRRLRSLHGMTKLKWLLFVVVYGQAWRKRKQQEMLLVGLPVVLRQITDRNDAICSLMTAVLLRRIRPKNIVGDDSILNRIQRFFSATTNQQHRYCESLSNNAVACSIEWDLPDAVVRVAESSIARPVILIVSDETAQGKKYSVHVRSMARDCAQRGWLTAAIICHDNAHANENNNEIRYAINNVSSKMKDGVPLFIVCYAMGAYSVVKYLGEEGQTNSTSKNLRGVVSIDNPMKIMKVGDQRSVTTESYSSSRCRNYIAHISVPTLIVFAQDDRQVCHNTETVLSAMISNPNMIVVRTKSGGTRSGHVTERVWRSIAEHAHDSTWANLATCKFFEAIIGTASIQQPRKEAEKLKVGPKHKPIQTESSICDSSLAIIDSSKKNGSMASGPTRSRL